MLQSHSSGSEPDCKLVYDFLPITHIIMNFYILKSLAGLESMLRKDLLTQALVWKHLSNFEFFWTTSCAYLFLMLKSGQTTVRSEQLSCVSHKQGCPLPVIVMSWHTSPSSNSNPAVLSAHVSKSAVSPGQWLCITIGSVYQGPVCCNRWDSKCQWLKIVQLHSPTHIRVHSYVCVDGWMSSHVLFLPYGSSALEDPGDLPFK